MEIKIFRRFVYGSPRIYPADVAAGLIAKLARKKTLDDGDLETARALGFKVVEVSDPELSGGAR